MLYSRWYGELAITAGAGGIRIEGYHAQEVWHGG